MPKPASFDKGKKIPDKEYKKKLDEYYAAKAKEKKKHNLKSVKTSPQLRKRLELELKSFKGRCVNKKLLRRIRNLAKEKFKIYPSAHANNWIKAEYKNRGGYFIEDNLDEQVKERRLRTRFHDFQLYKTIRDEATKRFHRKYPQISKNNWILKEYKKRGGTLSSDTPEPTITTPSGQSISMDGALFFNTNDSNLYTVEEETNERKIVERRGDAKEGDLWVHPNTGNLHMKVGDKWVTVNDPNKLPKLNKQKVKKDLSEAFAEKRKKEKTEIKEVVLEAKPKITRGQFLYKYKSPQNFYSWQDLAREHINCKYRSQQYIYDSPAYYLKDDLCNSLIHTNIDNLELTENPNIVNPSFFLLNSNKVNEIKYSFIECHKWNNKDAKDMLINPKMKFDVYVNFVIEPGKIHYYAFNWNNLKSVKFIQLPVADELIKEHFQTVVNLILLMNQQPDIITEEYIPSKIVPLQKKYKVQSDIKPRAICWVGKDFTTRVVKLKPKQDEDLLVVAGNKRKLRPHWRRGHWHTVLKGAKRKERKMRWYQPVFVLGNAA